jgi:hypothetical protein
MNDPHDPKTFDPKSVPGLTVWIKNGWDMLNDQPATALWADSVGGHHAVAPLPKPDHTITSPPGQQP